jgi:SAM-dependent methyltransferase
MTERRAAWASGYPDGGTTEVEALIDMAAAGEAAGAKDLEHLDGPAGAFNSVRMADLVFSVLESKPIRSPVLDWGCGYGQISWLLQRRGIQVTSFDIERRPARDHIGALSALSIQYGDDPARLPFASGTFAAVVCAGVLEHVANEEGSLREIHRVLKPGGRLFIFMLPNRFSWAEWIATRRGISVHPKKYTFGRASSLLENHDFIVERRWRRHFLPRNLTGLSRRIKLAYGRYYRQVESMDRILANCPPTSALSGVIEMICLKRE